MPPHVSLSTHWGVVPCRQRQVPNVKTCTGIRRTTVISLKDTQKGLENGVNESDWLRKDACITRDHADGFHGYSGTGRYIQLHAGYGLFEVLKYHTYKWVIIEGGSHPNQIVDAEIKQAVDAQLAAKGLTKTDNDKADLYVGYQISVDQERQWNAYSMGGVRWGGMASATSSTISNGTLVLDV